MSNIDFAPTAYTVKNPGNGKPHRYNDNDGYTEDAKRELERLVEVYPNAARFVVGDHFVQEYCRAYDASCWSGSGGYGLDTTRVFFKLVETGLGQAKFS